MTDPETSHEAALSITPKRLRDTQAAVLGMFHDYGPMTHEQLIERYLGDEDKPQQTDSGLRTRCRELVRLGKVRDSGKRDRLASGRQAIIWEAVE